jgi:tripartite-type tricarboxylate transporter receptor subunit TctC
LIRHWYTEFKIKAKLYGRKQMGRGTITRRSALAGSGAAFAALSLPRAAFAQKFPSRNIMITIPTGEGGGADRDARLFTSSWRKRLNTNFEFEFYPGAAGQVGTSST